MRLVKTVPMLPSDPSWPSAIAVGMRRKLPKKTRSTLGTRSRRNSCSACATARRGWAAWRRRQKRAQRPSVCFSISRSMPTANTEDLYQYEGTQRRVSPRPFRHYPPIRSSPWRSPSACPENSLKINLRSCRELEQLPRVRLHDPPRILRCEVRERRVGFAIAPEPANDGRS